MEKQMIPSKRRKDADGRWAGFLVCTILVSLMSAGSARGLDPKKAITQYVHEAWGIESGLPQTTVTAIAQTTEGNLWIGSRGGGLIRLKDGKFTTYTSKDGLSNDVILSLFEDSKGDLWIGTDGGGVSLLKEGKFTVYSTKNGLPDNAVYSLAGDPN